MIVTIAKIKYSNQMGDKAAEKSYVQNEEVKPAPGVAEVFLQPKTDPLDEHFQQEEAGEHNLKYVQHSVNGGR